MRQLRERILWMLAHYLCTSRKMRRDLRQILEQERRTAASLR